MDGTGDEWDAIARNLIRQHGNLKADQFEFDSESGLFCAYMTGAAKPDDLHALGEALQKIAQNPRSLSSILNSLIDSGDLPFAN